ncbi:hypothetical protein CAEBREN_24482 [Caenorhabditis brenneri]|uniref:Uncharacterized protein n=1 Tax=Caenorhabditis brenneri TaxID=135651 RepID=G0PDW6_CAEBE|nr:hypothetical protein CAEBREN_24482 [Caenorhabditis brenneri]
MDNGNKTIIGIVVCQSRYTLQCYVWCKETYVGNDGILFPNPENPVKTGDWVEIRFTKTEYQAYFSDDKTKKLPKFEAKNYSVIPEMYQTTVDGATIRVKLQQALTENQNVIEHHFFGNIYNNIHLKFPSGTWPITIRRVEPGNRDSVWVLENVETVPEPSGDSKILVTGIVVGHDHKYTYVWCKERPVTRDVTIKKPSDGSFLPLGTWITFAVEKDVFEKSFPVELPSNGFVPNYEIEEYVVMEKPLYPTELTINQTTVNLKLECFVKKNSNVKDISHEFVGLIMQVKVFLKRADFKSFRNQRFTFKESGYYRITIIRAKKTGDSPKSVWILKSRELVSPWECCKHSVAFQVSQPPSTLTPQTVQEVATLERQLKCISMNDLSTGVTPTNRVAPLPRPVHQVRTSDNTQPMVGYNTSSANPASSLKIPSQSVDQFRGPALIRSESGFSTGFTNQSNSPNPAGLSQTVNQIPNNNEPEFDFNVTKQHFEFQGSPLPAPRRHTPVTKTAIIYKMKKYQGTDSTYIWFFDEKIQAKLKPGVADEHDLKLGSIFSAEFVLDGNLWTFVNPNTNPPIKYETREDDWGEIHVRVQAKVLINAGEDGKKYDTVCHDYFGDIVSYSNQKNFLGDENFQVDRFNKLRDCTGAKYHIWIAGLELDGDFQWVIMEQIILED